MDTKDVKTNIPQTATTSHLKKSLFLLIPILVIAGFIFRKPLLSYYQESSLKWEWEDYLSGNWKSNQRDTLKAKINKGAKPEDLNNLAKVIECIGPHKIFFYGTTYTCSQGKYRRNNLDFEITPLSKKEIVVTTLPSRNSEPIKPFKLIKINKNTLAKENNHEEPSTAWIIFKRSR